MKIDDVYGAIGMVLRLSNTGFVKAQGSDELKSWLFNAVVTPSGAVMRTTPSLQLKEIVGKMNAGEQTMTDMNTLRKLLEAANENDMPEWGTVCGNPPYQEPGRGNGSAAPIWQHFFFIGTEIAQRMSIIAKANWRNAPQKTETKIRKQMIEIQEHITDLWVYDPSDTIFPDTLIRGGVAISMFDKRAQGVPRIVINDDEPIVANFEDVIYDPVAVAIFEKTSRESIKFYNYAVGIDRSRLRSFVKDFSKAPDTNHTIRTLAVFGGLGTTQSWGYLNKEAWNRNPEQLFSNYKFGILAGTNDIRSISVGLSRGDGLILEKNEMMGEGGRFLLFSNKNDAERCRRYFETKLVEYLILSTEKGRGNHYSDLVPDIEDYSSKNPLFKSDQELDVGHEFYGLDLNHRLYKLFELTDEEIAIVEANSTIK